MLQTITTGEVVLSLALGLVGFMVMFEKKKQANKIPLSSINRLPYAKSEKLLKDTRLKFFQALQNVVGEQYVVFSRVALSNFIQVKNGMNDSDHRKFEHEIMSRSIDFLLCEPRNTNVVAALMVEEAMDDEEIKTLKQIFHDAGVPLLSFRVRGAYAEEIKKQLQQVVRLKEDEPESEPAIA